jgi:catechol 2,3-dioxygenase-like lactoylglutathione lyase family enzyme
MTGYSGAYLRHAGIRTRDIPRTAEFYRRVFDLRVVGEAEQAIVLSDGTFNLTIVPIVDDASTVGPIVEGSEPIHLGFVVPDLLEAFRRCRELGAPILAGNLGRDPLPPGALPTASFKVADPNGNPVDVTGRASDWAGVRL